MTRLQFLLQQREWCNRWMDTPADQLPGTLTHDKVAAVSIDTECELIGFLGFHADGTTEYQEEVGAA